MVKKKETERLNHKSTLPRRKLNLTQVSTELTNCYKNVFEKSGFR